MGARVQRGQADRLEHEQHADRGADARRPLLGRVALVQGEGALRKFVLDRQLDVLDAARFMAMTSVARADAAIACFDAKYHYAFWRPITAIRAGDTDGNPATVGDPAGRPASPRRRTTPSTQARTPASHPPRAWRWPSSSGRTRSTSRSRA